MKKTLLVSSITLGIIAGASFLVGYTVDQHIESYLSGAVYRAQLGVEKVTGVSPEEQELIHIKVIKKERHLFSTKVTAVLTTAELATASDRPYEFTFDVLHGPFWLEKNANDERELVSGLFGIHYNYTLKMGDSSAVVAANLRHHFLHSGLVNVTTSGKIEGASFDFGAGFNYESSWDAKDFLLTRSFMDLDHVHIEELQAENGHFAMEHPQGIMSLYQNDFKEISTHYHLEKLESPMLAIHHLEGSQTNLLNQPKGLSGSATLASDFIALHQSSPALEIRELSLDANFTAPNFESSQLDLSHVLKDSKFFLEGSSMINDESLKISFDLYQEDQSKNEADKVQVSENSSLEKKLRGTSLQDEEMRNDGYEFASPDLEQMDHTLPRMQGAIALSWQSPCHDDNETALCHLIDEFKSKLKEEAYQSTDTSLTINVASVLRSIQENGPQ